MSDAFGSVTDESGKTLRCGVTPDVSGIHRRGEMVKAINDAYDEKIASQLIASSQPAEVPEVTAETIRATLEALKTNVLVHPSRFAETSRAFADEPLLTVSQSPHLLPDTMLVIKGSVTIELPPRR